MNMRIAVLVLALGSALISGCAALVVGGVAAGTAVATDRRLPDVLATDERIEFQAGQRLSQKFGDKAHINVTSYNKQVLISGEVQSEAMKTDAESIVLQLPDVRAVFNELVVGPIPSLGARSNDTYITSEVKARFVSATKFNPLAVKVVTEAGTVYLMGLVTKEESAEAAGLARHATGVKRVVRLFEIIPTPPPAEKK